MIEMIADVNRLAEVGGEMLRAAIQHMKAKEDEAKKRAAMG